MRNRRLTACFNLEDFCFSETAVREGICNLPGAAGDGEDPGASSVLQALTLLAKHILEPVRQHFNTRPQISSGYRSQQLNTCVGGSPRSQHLTGQAVDFELPDHDLLTVARWMEMTLDFDQLLLERAGGKTWIHASYVSPALNRREVKWFDGETWNPGLPASLPCRPGSSHHAAG